MEKMKNKIVEKKEKKKDRLAHKWGAGVTVMSIDGHWFKMIRASGPPRMRTITHFFAKNLKGLPGEEVVAAQNELKTSGHKTFGKILIAHPSQFTTARIKKVSFDVIVRFFNKRLRKIVCETQHTLVFVDSGSQKFTSIPEAIKISVVKYQEEI